MQGRRPGKTGGVTISPTPKCAETHFLPLGYIEDFFGLRTMQIAADRSTQ
jgi:hypothetical protein